MPLATTRWTVEADPRLRAWVECIAFSIDEERASPTPIRVLPDAHTDLLFCVEADPGDSTCRERSCSGNLFGIKTAPLIVADLRPVEKIAVCFRPGAARRFFELPAHELADRAIDIGMEALWGSEARQLTAEIGACSRASGRKAIIERALLRRLERADCRAGARVQAARAILASAVQQIQQSSGRSSVRELCRQSECSPRRLERIFQEWVGIGPKRLSRLVRFDSSRKALQRGESQLDVALHAGYADQSHLLRDFRAFSGTTPGALFGRALDS